MQFGLIVSIVGVILLFEKLGVEYAVKAKQNYIEINIEEETIATYRKKIRKPLPQIVHINDIIIEENIYEKWISKSEKKLTDFTIIDLEYIEGEQEEEEEDYIRYVKQENKKPEFPGGIKGLKRYIVGALNYPQNAIDSGIQGKVYVRFTINKWGKVVKPNVIRKIHPLIDNEAIRIIENMPSWKAGIVNGEKVALPFTLPITFKIYH